MESTHNMWGMQWKTSESPLDDFLDEEKDLLWPYAMETTQAKTVKVTTLILPLSFSAL